MIRRGLTLVCLSVLIMAIAIGSWKVYTDRALRHLQAREDDPNPVKARSVGGIRISLSAPVAFTHVVVDDKTLPNGRKPKVIIDPDGQGAVVGAQYGNKGFALYRPGRAPSIINTYSLGIGDEDAQAADLDGNGSPDIVVGGLDKVMFVLYNPNRRRCPNVYHCTWKRAVIDSVHPSHDVLVGDVDRDGKNDVVTEAGVYFNRGRGHAWQFAGRGLIPRDGEGTGLGAVSPDGILDVFAPYQSGTRLARFVNPLHHGGDPIRQAWRTQIIDPHPRFAGNMTIAIADMNGDGRNDIVLAPMYGGGGLVWYENPKLGATVWFRHMIDPTINFVHQGSLQIGNFDEKGGPDIAFAEQDQSPTRRVGVFYNEAGNGTHWRLQVHSTAGGHHIKVGTLRRARRLSFVSARHGYLGGKNPLTAWEAEHAPPSE